MSGKVETYDWAIRELIASRTAAIDGLREILEVCTDRPDEALSVVLDNADKALEQSEKIHAALMLRLMTGHGQ